MSKIIELHLIPDLGNIILQYAAADLGKVMKELMIHSNTIINCYDEDYVARQTFSYCLIKEDHLRKYIYTLK
jgi:hypothetical protein